MPREIRKRQESTDEDEVQRQVVDEDAGNEQGGDDNDKEEEVSVQDEEYEIERIIHVRKTKAGHTEYLVKWLGYPDAENSWVPEEDCTAPDLIQEFQERRATERAKKVGKASKGGEDAVMADATGPRKIRKMMASRTMKSTKGNSNSATTSGRPKSFQEVNQGADEDETMDDGSQSIIPYNSMVEYQQLDDWSDLIDEIMTVDHASTESMQVTYFMKLKDGSLRSAPSQDMVKKAAIRVIAFYERNLRFREDDQA
ncbi:Heterochromatin protein 1c [Serendipita sp. 401]|nr:Heterochromatin protein 1c [Serendipita sp. 401]KAG9055851.1 Heterochromatin protein 1c [Serendipita sp. 407]